MSAQDPGPPPGHWPALCSESDEMVNDLGARGCARSRGPRLFGERPLGVESLREKGFPPLLEPLWQLDRIASRDNALADAETWESLRRHFGNKTG